MTNKQSIYTGRVPFAQKLAFGLGMLANQTFPAAQGFFMVVLVQNLGFSPLMSGIIGFIPRLFDAITDPIMGFISDNTRSSWGKRRQYVFVGAIIMGISFIAMWQLYKESGIVFNFWYFLSLSMVFTIGLTIFSVPFVAMGYEMTDDFHERTKIMASAQFIGQWAWIFMPWAWLFIYDPRFFTDPESGVRELAVYVGIVCCLLALIPAIFVKSRSTIDDKNLIPIQRDNIGSGLVAIVKGFKDAFNNIPFRKLCIATFLIFNSFQTIAGFTFFIIVYYLFAGDAAAANPWPALHGSIGALITAFLVIPIITFMSKRIGKKNTFMVSQGISLIGYILFWFLFVPGKPYLFLYALPFHSFGIGGLFTLMMSMTADACDYEEYRNGLPRKEGIFGAIYWWMVKVGNSIAILLGGLIMTYVGFYPEIGATSEESITGLRIAYTLIPISCTLLAMYVMHDYEINEKRAKEISNALELSR